MKTNELDATTHTYLKGYWEAIWDFAIWKDGVQKIGCLDTPIKEAMELKLKKFDITFEDFIKSV